MRKLTITGPMPFVPLCVKKGHLANQDVVNLSDIFYFAPREFSIFHVSVNLHSKWRIRIAGI